MGFSASFCLFIDPNIGFQEERQFFAENWRKSPKIGKNRRKW
jgi:hypothetical protein